MNESYLADLYDPHGHSLPRAPLLMNLIETNRSLLNDGEQSLNMFAHRELLGKSISRYKHQLFHCLMALARNMKIPYVSIGKVDLISADRKNGEFFNKGFIWEAPRALGMGNSCGNGMGSLNRQTQYSFAKCFEDRHLGIWNPKYVTKVCTKPFCLETDYRIIEKFVVALKGGQANLDFYLQSDEFITNHICKVYDKRFK